MEKCCFITGHRPNRFKFSEWDARCQKIKDTIEAEIKRLHDEQGIHGVWVGGAMGVDTWAAEIVLALQKKEKYQNLALHLAIPFEGFDRDLPLKQKGRCQRILSECTDSVVVCKKQLPDAYKRRDYYMVDHSVCGIAVYDSDKSIRSGTGMTYNYAALKKGLPVTLIHPDTAVVSR